MEQNKEIKVGVVGTSWWADAMYMPAVQKFPAARVVAAAGRNLERARAFAADWDIPQVFPDYKALIDSSVCDALIISTPNDVHHEIASRALEAGLHVLCEKPLTIKYAEAAELAELAERKGVKHMTPFTYRFMPSTRYLKDLIETGYLGRHFHLNMRYYANYGRQDEYMWRFDKGIAGSGVLGDLGSHFLYLADWYFGDITGLYCRLGSYWERPALDPQGKPYEPTDQTALMIVEFASGAQGAIHVTTLAHEDTNFGQIHQMDFHGSDGTLRHYIDWDRVQEVSGARVGEGAVGPLQVPEAYWQGIRRDHAHNTYKDTFREHDFMTRGWLRAILDDTEARPDFHDGARIQRCLEAAEVSDREGRWVRVDEII